MLLKHSPKELIIGKSMAFQDHMNRICRRNQIPVNKRKPIFVLIFQKCNAHAFLKKAAEISGLQISNLGNLRQRN